MIEITKIDLNCKDLKPTYKIELDFDIEAFMDFSSIIDVKEYYSIVGENLINQIIKIKGENDES